MGGTTVGEMIESAADLRVHNTGTEGCGETWERKYGSTTQKQSNLWERTGTTLAEASEKRVRPTTFAVGVQGQVLGIYVG